MAACSLARQSARSGLAMAGVTAVLCQLNKNPNAAMALSFGLLTLLYLLCAVGNVQENEPLVAVSLLGLLLQAKIYVDNNWLPVIITLIVALALSAVAFTFAVSGIWARD